MSYTIMSCIVHLLDYFLYWPLLFFQCYGMFSWNGSILLVLCRRTNFKLRLELSIKSRQSLASYCPTTRGSRTCSRSLKYTKSVVCLKNGKKSASRFLWYVTSVPDSNQFFSFKGDTSGSGGKLDFEVCKIGFLVSCRNSLIFMRFLLMVNWPQV